MQQMLCITNYYKLSSLVRTHFTENHGHITKMLTVSLNPDFFLIDLKTRSTSEFVC